MLIGEALESHLDMCRKRKIHFRDELTEIMLHKKSFIKITSNHEHKDEEKIAQGLLI